MKYENYAEFEKLVVDTFNRMHIVDTCDDGFIEGGYEWDVGNILSKAMKDMFHIKGHTVCRTELMNLYLDDLDMFLLEALESFNDIMNKYNVVPAELDEFTQMCALHIV